MLLFSQISKGFSWLGVFSCRGHSPSTNSTRSEAPSGSIPCQTLRDGEKKMQIMKANDSLVVHKASGKSLRLKEEKIQCGEREAGGTWGAGGCSNRNHKRMEKGKAACLG